MRISDILIKPVITEKALDGVKRNIYRFQVNKSANKFQIKDAVEAIFKVEVETVRVSTRKGKQRRVGRKRMLKQLPDKKIAMVILSKGTIELFPKS